MTLDLDSPEWSSLQDAYGPATVIPSLLTALANQDDDMLDELYDRICHQGSIYSASIAAFPHLIRIANDAETLDAQSDALALAGLICESNDLPSALQSSSHADSFSAALPLARELSNQALRETTDANDGIYFLKAAMSFAGYASLARVLDGVVNEEFTLNCPDCDVDLYVTPTERGLTVAAEDPVSQPRAKKTQVSKGTPVGEGGAELDRLLSSAPSLADVGRQVAYIFGSASCPACGAKFSLISALIDGAT
jgi:hypothetical protein